MSRKASFANLSRLRASGKNTDAIAAELGVHRNTVLRWCRSLDIPARDGKGVNHTRSTWRSPEIEKLYRLLYWERGMTLKEIGKREGVGPSCIQRRFKILGIGSRPPGKPKRSAQTAK